MISSTGGAAQSYKVNFILFEGLEDRSICRYKYFECNTLGKAVLNVK